MFKDIKVKLALSILFFLFVFLFSINEVWDFDIWFHLKSGEIISQQGIIHHDVFSYNTEGREWFPYEWLFQITVYYFKAVFGFESIKYLVASFATLIVLLIFTITRKIFNLNFYQSLVISFFFYVSVHEFFTPRPHLFAYLFLVTNLFLILLYFFKGKNLLWVTLPITILWSNLHGSIFLSIALFLGYSFVALLSFLKTKEKIWLKKAKTLALYSFTTAFFTILPPLGFLQYQLLWKFFNERDIITKFIDEWTPLSTNPIGFVIFSITIFLFLIPFFWILFKKKNFTKAFWLIPLLPFLLVVYTAVRNAFFGYLTLTFLLIWIFTNLDYKSLKGFKKYSFLLIIFLLITSHIFILGQKRQEEASRLFYYPEKATQFIKNNNLSGHMFNEYGHGGYLLYHLYPNQKVFFDGRTDLYLCCEMPYILELAVKKNLPDSEYKTLLDNMWQKYDISFVLVRTEKHNLLRKITRILEDDQNWDLVFWDDYSQIFIRKDGKNEQLLSQFGTLAATPYNKEPFQQGLEQQALIEYQKMTEIADSSKSRNAIGYILLRQSKFDEAKKEFEKAIELHKFNESPYMNLAELSAKDGQIEKAISLYQQAQKLAPDRGLIYIRLGQLNLQLGKTKEAKQIWQTGLKNTVDSEAKTQLSNLLSNI